MAEIFKKIANVIGEFSSEIAVFRFKNQKSDKVDNSQKSSKSKSSKRSGAVKYDDKIYKVLRNRNVNYIDYGKEKAFQALMNLISQVN